MGKQRREDLLRRPGVYSCGLEKRKGRVAVMSRGSKYSPKRMVLGAEGDLRVEGRGWQKGVCGCFRSASRALSGKKVPFCRRDASVPSPQQLCTKPPPCGQPCPVSHSFLIDDSLPTHISLPLLTQRLPYKLRVWHLGKITGQHRGCFLAV